MAKDDKKRKEADRATRLSDALRENLHRRKQQARDRKPVDVQEIASIHPREERRKP